MSNMYRYIDISINISIIALELGIRGMFWKVGVMTYLRLIVFFFYQFKIPPYYFLKIGMKIM